MRPAATASFVENERSLVVAWIAEDPRLGCVSREVHQLAQLPAQRRPACLGLSLSANWAWPMGEAHPSAPGVILLLGQILDAARIMFFPWKEFSYYS